MQTKKLRTVAADQGVKCGL